MNKRDTGNKKIRVVKTIKNLLLISGIVAISYIYIQYNLKANSVYYARNIPHGENVDSEMMMILDNWLFIDIPVGKYYHSSGIRDGGFSFSRLDEKGDQVELIYNTYTNSYIYANLIDDMTYEIDTSGKVLAIMKDGSVLNKVYDYKKDGSYDPEKEKKIIKKVRKFIKPILDANTKPLINLQWLFNIKYFNYFY